MIFLGQTAVFQCDISEPASAKVTQPHSVNYEITWLRDDQPLQLDHRMKVLPSGMLEITEARLSDRAEYGCKVVGKDGSSKLSRQGSLKINLDMGKWDALRFTCFIR